MSERTGTHGYSRYKRGCRCEVCRAANAKSVREYAARRKARTGLSPWEGRSAARRIRYDLQCEGCGTDFRAESRAQRFCSLVCFGKAKRKHSRELVHVGPAKPRIAPMVAPTTTVTTPKYWDLLVAGPCNWCGSQFVGRGSTSLYCSKRCLSKAHRRDQYWIAPPARRAIYERDGWVCQLCKAPVDADADPLSDWFPSLDHIVPQSHTLIPDHSPANLRTAHRWCNAVRGDGTYHADLFQEAS